MNIKKKILWIFILLFTVFQAKTVLASNSLNAYLFYGDACPHCAKEEQFLSTIEDKYPELKINQFEIYHNQDNVKLFKQVARDLKVNANGVPFLIIGDKSFLGYEEGHTPGEIEKQIQNCLSGGCSDEVAKIVGIKASKIDVSPSLQDSKPLVKMINVPFLGKVDIMKFSLPLITIIIGTLDGFNPCAMWTLIFLIGLLLGMKNRKRMWILGSTFIFISAFVYFLFMTAWLNLILFIGFIFWVRIIIGVVALAGGGYSLYEFLYNKDASCKVGDGEKKKKTFLKMKAIIQKNSFWLALGGIILLAFVVNLIELVCSAGFPAVYTQVLLLNDLSVWQRYLHLFAYIFFYMIDDLFVFIIAMLTLKITGITTKYVRASRLIGGILMLIIGILLIVKPELLMFG